MVGLALPLLFLVLSALPMSSGTSVAPPRLSRVWRPMGVGGAYDLGSQPTGEDPPMQIAMNPFVNGSLFLVSDRENMYRSDDYGKSWVPRVHRLEETININEVQWNLTDPTGGSITMTYGVGDMLMVDGGAISGGLMQSSNGGDTWDKLNCATCPTMPIRTIAFSARPGSGVVYAGSGMKGGCGSPGDDQGPQVFYSHDNGKTWIKNAKIAQGVRCMNIEQIIVDPQNENTTYIRTSNGIRGAGAKMMALLKMSVNHGADYYDVPANPLAFPALAIPVGISLPGTFSMSMNAIGTKWIVAYADGRVYLASRSFFQNYTNNSWWAGVDYTGPIGQWEIEPLRLTQTQGEHLTSVLFDPYSSVNHTQIFYSKRNSSTSDGLFVANLTGAYPSHQLVDETLIGEITLAKEPGYNLTKWTVGSVAVQPVSRQPLGLMDERSEAYAAYRRAGHFMYVASGRNVYHSHYRMRAEDSEHQEAGTSLKTAFADWTAVYTRNPTGVVGHTNRGYNSHRNTFVAYQKENPLKMFIGSESEIGFYSVVGGGAWTSQKDAIIAASLSQGDTTEWMRASFAVSLNTLPNQFLISLYSVAGKVHSDKDTRLGYPGLFLLSHDEQYRKVNLPIMSTFWNESDVQPSGEHMWNNLTYAEFTGLNTAEIGAMAADEWSTDRAIIGNDRGAVFMISNLQSTFDRVGEPEVTLIGHSYYAPNFFNFSNVTNTTDLVVNDNTKYFGGECSQVNSISACPYCGYETYFVICPEGVYRWNETGKEPFYNPPRGGTLENKVTYNATAWGMLPGVCGSQCGECSYSYHNTDPPSCMDGDGWLIEVMANGKSWWYPSALSPGTFYHRDPNRRRAPDIAYIKYEEFLKLTPSAWETLYLLSNETVYASVDNGDSWIEVLLAGYIAQQGIPVAYDLLYPFFIWQIDSEKRNLGFTGMAVTGETEKTIYVAVRGYNRVWPLDTDPYVEQKLSSAILVGVPTAGYSLNATVYTWTVLEQRSDSGELGLRVDTLFTAPPIGLATLERVYAVTEHQGLWLHDPGNLLKNPGAEMTNGANINVLTAFGHRRRRTASGPDHWTAGGHSSTGIGTWDSTRASHGFWSLCFPVAGAYWRSDKIDVDPGVQYRLMGYTSGRVRARVIPYWGDVSQNHIKTEADYSDAPGGWSLFRVDFVLDLHINQVEIQVESIDATPSAADHLWFGPVVNDVIPDSLSPEAPLQGMNVSYKPDSPLPPTVKSFDSSSITLQWNLPLDHMWLEPITKYAIYKRRSGLGFEYDPLVKVTDVSQLAGEVLEYKVTGLLYGTEYQFVMDASTGVGSSNRSGALIASTGPQLADAPGKPVLFGTASSSYLILQIPAPASDGNTPILNYKVYTADPIVGQYDSGRLFDASGTARVDGLQTSYFYIFRVSAINAVGEGPLSPVSALLMTKDEVESNVTMRFYPSANFDKTTNNYPLGYATEANFRELIELDVARSIGIPQTRVNFIQRNGRYFSFWIRAVGGTSTISVADAMELLALQTVDPESDLHKGVLTYQVDTHYLLNNGQPANLAAARLTKGGPTQRLDAWTGVIIGLCGFIVFPTWYTLNGIYEDYKENLLLAELYKDKYKDNHVDGTD